MAATSGTPDLQVRLQTFVDWRRNHLDGDEKGEAQLFLERLFLAFGHAGLKEAGATLEKRVAKRSAAGTAFADLVWRPRLLLEMKKAGQLLAKHYQQAFEYWIDLVPGRPDYMVLCNFDEFWIYDLNKQLDEPVDRVALVDLPKRWEAMGFMLPTPVAPVFGNDLEAVNRDAAATLVGVTNSLLERGINRERAQRFSMQCLVSFVAEDIGLLPRHLLTEAIEHSVDGGSAYDLLFGLFDEMNRPGVTPAGRYAGTPYFNGGLFRSVQPFDLEVDELVALHSAASFDWTEVRPEIFGTIFEQSMGKDERHALGAHFTSGADIQRVVLPTIVKPWRSRIEGASTARELGEVERDLLAFRVLDPACGCGNFLYIAYRELRKLEKEIHDLRASLSRRRTTGPRGTAALSFIRPGQFYGIDINPFAVEIAKVTLMLGKQLAAAELGDEHAVLPLDDLESNIVVGDALLMDWPEFDACVGNPPYLGRRKLVQERGAQYMHDLNERYPDVGGVSDYVVYWFRKTHDQLPQGGRAGLVGTNTVRQTDTRGVSLDYIIDNGGTITDAWANLDWSGDAAVYVSIVNWIKSPWDGERTLWLDEGQRKVLLPEITGGLSEQLDLRSATNLRANALPKVFFQGQTAGHTAGFVLTDASARSLVNRDPKSHAVTYPYIVGDDLLNRGRPGRWILDFDAADATEAKALAPGAYEQVRNWSCLTVRRPHRRRRRRTKRFWPEIRQPNATGTTATSSTVGGSCRTAATTSSPRSRPWTDTSPSLEWHLRAEAQSFSLCRRRFVQVTPFSASRSTTTTRSAFSSRAFTKPGSARDVRLSRATSDTRRRLCSAPFPGHRSPPMPRCRTSLSLWNGFCRFETSDRTRGSPSLSNMTPSTSPA